VTLRDLILAGADVWLEPDETVDGKGTSSGSGTDYVFGERSTGYGTGHGNSGGAGYGNGYGSGDGASSGRGNGTGYGAGRGEGCGNGFGNGSGDGDPEEKEEGVYRWKLP